jgi:hypothetical protein
MRMIETLCGPSMALANRCVTPEGGDHSMRHFLPTVEGHIPACNLYKVEKRFKNETAHVYVNTS